MCLKRLLHETLLCKWLLKVDQNNSIRTEEWSLCRVNDSTSYPDRWSTQQKRTGGWRCVPRPSSVKSWSNITVRIVRTWSWADVTLLRAIEFETDSERCCCRPHSWQSGNTPGLVVTSAHSAFFQHVVQNTRFIPLHSKSTTKKNFYD